MTAPCFAFFPRSSWKRSVPLAKFMYSIVSASSFKIFSGTTVHYNFGALHWFRVKENDAIGDIEAPTVSGRVRHQDTMSTVTIQRSLAISTVLQERSPLHNGSPGRNQ